MVVAFRKALHDGSLCGSREVQSVQRGAGGCGGQVFQRIKENNPVFNPIRDCHEGTEGFFEDASGSASSGGQFFQQESENVSAHNTIQHYLEGTEGFFDEVHGWISSSALQHVIRCHGLPRDFDFPLSLSWDPVANREAWASNGPFCQRDSYGRAALLPVAGLCGCIVGTSGQEGSNVPWDLSENRTESHENECRRGDPAGAFVLRFKACQGLIGELSFDGDEPFAGLGPSGACYPASPLHVQEDELQQSPGHPAEEFHSPVEGPSHDSVFQEIANGDVILGDFLSRFQACPGLIGEFSFDGDDSFADFEPSNNRSVGALLQLQVGAKQPAQEYRLPGESSYHESDLQETDHSDDGGPCLDGCGCWHECSSFSSGCSGCGYDEVSSNQPEIPLEVGYPSRVHLSPIIGFQDATGQVQQCVGCNVRDRLSNGSEDDINHLVTRKNQEPYWVNRAVTGEQLDDKWSEQSTGTQEHVNHLVKRKPYWAGLAVTGERPLEVGASSCSPWSYSDVQFAGERDSQLIVSGQICHDPSERWDTCPGPVEESRRGQAAHQGSHGLSAELSVDLILKGETDETGLCPTPCLLPVCCHVQGGFQLGKHGQVASQGSSEQDGERRGVPNIFIGAGLDGTNPYPCSFPECCPMQAGGQAGVRGQVASQGSREQNSERSGAQSTFIHIGQGTLSKVEVRQVREVRLPALGQGSKTAKGVAPKTLLLAWA